MSERPTESNINVYMLEIQLTDQMQTASIAVLYSLNPIIEHKIDIKQLRLRYENHILKVHTAVCESVQYNVLPQEQGTSVRSFLPFAYFVYLIKLSNLEPFFIFLNKGTR